MTDLADRLRPAPPRVRRSRGDRSGDLGAGQGVGELVARARSGNHAAFDELARCLRPTIVACARRCGLGPATADDLVQETLLSLYRHLDAIRSCDAVVGWVRTTAMRLAWSLKQADHVDVARFDKLVPCLVAPTSPEDHVVAVTERERVRTAYIGLPDRDRDVLALTVLPDEPRPYDEIAAALGCAVGSVGPFRMRSLDRLDRALRINGRPAPATAPRASRKLVTTAT